MPWSLRLRSELAETLVTGATGFIGSHVARLLVERGDEVRLGVEDGSPDTAIADLDCKRVKLDVRDRRSVRRALKGVERVFHCAGVTSVRPADEERLFEVNVGGTKLVMEECLRAEVERVVYTSSAAAVGPAANGKAATETQLFTAARLGIPYVNSVHEAEVEAMRVAAHGLPLVCVNPAVCLGAGDHLLSSTRLVRSFLLGRIPVYTDGAIGIVDVRDAAAGHLLADVRGAVGERYLLAGRNFTFERLFADLGRLSGVPTPVRIPPRAAEAAAAVLGAGGRAWPLTPSEVRAAGNSWTYRSTKAQRVLGWRARPHEETLEATVAWHLEREHDRIARTRRSQQIQYRLGGPRAGSRRGGRGRRAPNGPAPFVAVGLPGACAGCHIRVKKEVYAGSLRRDSHGPHPACRNAGATRCPGIDARRHRAAPHTPSAAGRGARASPPQPPPAASRRRRAPRIHPGSSWWAPGWRG